MLVQCCVCKKAHVDGSWKEVDEVSVDGPIRKGYCPPCCEAIITKAHQKRAEAHAHAA